MKTNVLMKAESCFSEVQISSIVLFIDLMKLDYWRGVNALKNRVKREGIFNKDYANYSIDLSILLDKEVEVKRYIDSVAYLTSYIRLNNKLLILGRLSRACKSPFANKKVLLCINTLNEIRENNPKLAKLNII